MRIDISICPTDLEVGSEGDRYDEGALLDAIREFVAGKCSRDAEIDVQVGHRQGDTWARIDGDDEAGEALLNEFWAERGADEDLFAHDPIDLLD